MLSTEPGAGHTEPFACCGSSDNIVLPSRLLANFEAIEAAISLTLSSVLLHLRDRFFW